MKKSVNVLISLAIVLTMVFGMATIAVPENGVSFGLVANAADGVQLKRLAGEGRQQTAALISKEAYASAQNVFVASGDNAADALAGVPLAYAMNAPILLIRPGTGLDNDTKTEIQRLGAKNVYILGGEGAIPAKVEKDIQSLGCKTSRIAGTSRFDTAVAIANKLKEIKGSPTEVFFVYSHNYPDALAVSGVAALKGAPILYVYGDGDLRASAGFMQTAKSVTKAYVIGGYSAIKEAADTNIKKFAPVQRVYGDNRYLTCDEINKTFASVLTGESVCIATGKNFPDALAGGVLAAKTRSPMLLVGDSLLDYQFNYVKGRKPLIIYIFGGNAAVSDYVAQCLLSDTLITTTTRTTTTTKRPTTTTTSKTTTTVKKTTTTARRTTTTAPQRTNTGNVWIPATGNKYHSINNCGKMNPSKARSVTREWAESHGYEPCTKCF